MKSRISYRNCCKILCKKKICFGRFGEKVFDEFNQVHSGLIASLMDGFLIIDGQKPVPRQSFGLARMGASPANFLFEQIITK